MGKLSFTPFDVVHGLSGASGLIYDNDTLILISDDSYVVYLYAMDSGCLHKLNFHPTDRLKEQMEKSIKPDFEAIAHHDGVYYVFGSGSAKNRFKMLSFNLPELSFIQRISLSEIYRKMMDSASITEEDFNIEAVVLSGSAGYFFNRGNGPGRKNGIFAVSDWQEVESADVDYIPISLQEIEGVPFGFTDAVCVDDTIYFTACAEETMSTYDDGRILASGVGQISLKNLRLKGFNILTEEYKLEGITLYKREENKLTFLLCEDADDGVPETKVFSLQTENILRGKEQLVMH